MNAPEALPVVPTLAAAAVMWTYILIPSRVWLWIGTTAATLAAVAALVFAPADPREAEEESNLG
ncbi:hypothetical protein HQQ81_05685 [Microbacteriaceae bacterium VKM Ac-2854]|nr:hypothetical protein [Microbacteriaceae bacterium VKM Ac-2854]